MTTGGVGVDIEIGVGVVTDAIVGVVILRELTGVPAVVGVAVKLFVTVGVCCCCGIFGGGNLI